ncbi:MAG: MOSC domain-containing protein [Gemmatimonadaceae bacterium]
MPKRPVERALVTVNGVVGDRQRDLENHGGVQRALCLYSAELLDALRAEGHDVGPGVTGENLTIRGVAWDAMTAGTRFRAGPVEGEVTGYANPCHNIHPYFVDGRGARIAQKLHPGWSRVYARVLLEGEVGVGAPFELLIA